MLTTPAFHVMVKPRGAICNLNCQYCYYLDKQDLYPDSNFFLSDDLLESFTRQYINAQPANQVSFTWQGGEPLLMGIPFYQRAITLQKKYARQGMLIQNTLQTNGTLLNDEWCRFFKKHHFLVGLSIDGPQNLHDLYRLTKTGAGSFSKVLQGWRLLQSYNIDTNILCSVHKGNQDYPLDVYRFFRDELKAQFIQFIPIVNSWAIKNSENACRYSVDANKYGIFLNAIFDEWYQHDIGVVFVQIFDVALGIWLGQPGSLCIFSPTCGTALALEHNGDLYSCDHYVNPEYFVGNINDNSLANLVSSQKQRQFGLDKTTKLPPVCKNCEYLFACQGGCPKDRFLETPDGQPGLNYLCAGFKIFFKHIDQPMRKMANHLR